MKVLFILHHPPYGTEHCFNALRLAGAMAKKSPEAQITVFLMAESVWCAKAEDAGRLLQHRAHAEAHPHR